MLRLLDRRLFCTTYVGGGAGCSVTQVPCNSRPWIRHILLAAAEEQLRRMGALALAGQVGGWGGGRGAQSWEYAVTRVVVHR